MLYVKLQPILMKQQFVSFGSECSSGFQGKINQINGIFSPKYRAGEQLI